MGKPSIVEKLTEHLKFPISREADAVYLMVEIRKVLDHAYEKNNFTLIRFYADWFLHTEKSRRLLYIEPVIRRVYEGIKYQIENFPLSVPDRLPIIGFMEMEDLQAEMKDLFLNENLPLTLFDNAAWKAFVRNAIGVLVDQPIINPIEQVSEFRFLPATSGSVVGIVYFTTPINNTEGRNYFYKFGNAD